MNTNNINKTRTLYNTNRTSFLRGNRVEKVKFDSSSLITDGNDITICAQSIIINAKRKSFFQENRPKG